MPLSTTSASFSNEDVDSVLLGFLLFDFFYMIYFKVCFFLILFLDLNRISPVLG